MWGWVGTFSILVAVILLGRKIRFGWALEIVGSAAWVFEAIVSSPIDWALLTLNAVFVVLAVLGWVQWKPEIKASPVLD